MRKCFDVVSINKTWLSLSLPLSLFLPLSLYLPPFLSPGLSVSPSRPLYPSLPLPRSLSLYLSLSCFPQIVIIDLQCTCRYTCMSVLLHICMSHSRKVRLADCSYVGPVTFICLSASLPPSPVLCMSLYPPPLVPSLPLPPALSGLSFIFSTPHASVSFWLPFHAPLQP